MPSGAVRYKLVPQSPVLSAGSIMLLMDLCSTYLGKVKSKVLAGMLLLGHVRLRSLPLRDSYLACGVHACRIAYRHESSLDEVFAALTLRAQCWPRDMQDVLSRYWVAGGRGGA
jgi:hypothetical protein